MIENKENNGKNENTKNNEYIEIKMDNLGDTLKTLKAGDKILLSGTIYSARDAAHVKIIADIESGKGAPFQLENAGIYYAGPCPAKPGKIVGPYGPTTSGRMDKYAAYLLDRGIKIMIGKGDRTPDVIESMKKNGAVYFAAIGGAGAAIAEIIKKQEMIAYPELGAEAIYKLTVEEFPLIVAIDSYGGNIYSTEPKKFEGVYSKNINR